MIKSISGSVVQGSNDGAVIYQIDTGLGVLDQKTLWRIVGFEAEWVNATAITAKAAWIVKAILTRDSAKLVFTDNEFMGQIAWAANAGVAPTAVQALPLEPIKRNLLVDDQLMANSKFYLVLATSFTAVANNLRFKVYYEEMKVTELEFLKAQTGYCVC